MPDIQLGAHTVRSHGVQVLKIHWHDWLILVFLAGLDLGLNLIEPFHRFVGEGMMSDLKYPLQDNTVPFWGVPVGSFFLLRNFILWKNSFYFDCENMMKLLGCNGLNCSNAQ